MSADNWRVCPQCKKNAEAKQKKLANDAGESYGKVTPEEYLHSVKRAAESVKLSETLREDYELGIGADGQFYCSYGGSCQQCGFEFSFDHHADAMAAQKKAK